jgi:hypothetical protein
MIPFIQAASKALDKSPHAAMTTNKYLKHQVQSWMVDHSNYLDVDFRNPVSITYQSPSWPPFSATRFQNVALDSRPVS